jgi:hypothetical protein
VYAVRAHYSSSERSKVGNCENLGNTAYFAHSTGAIHHLVPGAEEAFAGLTTPTTILADNPDYDSQIDRDHTTNSTQIPRKSAIVAAVLAVFNIPPYGRRCRCTSYAGRQTGGHGQCAEGRESTEEDEGEEQQ